MNKEGLARIYVILIFLLLIIPAFIVYINKDPLLIKYHTVWSLNLYPKSANYFHTNLLKKDSQIYAQSDYPFLLEIDSSSGQINKEFWIGKYTNVVDFSGDTLYYRQVENKNNYLHALDVSTWVEKWSNKIPYPEDISSHSNIISTKDKVYITLGINRVVALDAESGKELWSFDATLNPDNRVQIASIPTISASESVVAAGFTDGMLYALDAQSGKAIWEFNTSTLRSPNTRPSSPLAILVTDKMVHVDSYRTFGGDVIYALDIENGEIKWHFNFEGTDFTRMRFDSGIFYIVKKEGFLQAINSDDGRVLWKIKTEGSPTKLEISDGILYFGTSGQEGLGTDFAYLYAVNSQTGKTKWKFKIKDQITDVVSIKDTMYFVKRNGELIAIQ